MKKIEIDHLEGSSKIVQLKIFLGTVIKSTNLTRHYSMTKQYNWVQNNFYFGKTSELDDVICVFQLTEIQ